MDELLAMGLLLSIYALLFIGIYSFFWVRYFWGKMNHGNCIFHPERRKGEIWLTNRNKHDAWRGRSDIRHGTRAYNVWGKEIIDQDFVAVFVPFNGNIIWHWIKGGFEEPITEVFWRK